MSPLLTEEQARPTESTKEMTVIPEDLPTMMTVEVNDNKEENKSSLRSSKENHELLPGAYIISIISY